MAKLVRPAGGDFNEYGAAGDALAPFAELARARGVHLALVHHARKGGGDFGEQALGSTAWAGGVDTIIDLRRDPENRGAVRRDTEPVRHGHRGDRHWSSMPRPGARAWRGTHGRRSATRDSSNPLSTGWGGQPHGATMTEIRRAEPIVGSSDAIAIAVRRMVHSGMLVSDTSGRYPVFMARA